MKSIKQIIACAAFIGALGTSGLAAPWSMENGAWNVNLNPDGSNPSQYYGDWPGHSYFPSPADWRTIPVYQMITDRYTDGEPTNNDGDYGGYDVLYVDTRHGGDFVGLTERLDYIKSLGYKSIWISPVFQNRENSYHGYGQIDFTLLDKRFGTLEEFRAMVDKAHSLGMYVIVDIIVNHMSDLYHFAGYPNGNAPFRLHAGEYNLVPHNPGEEYVDFKVNNSFTSNGSYCDVYDSQGWRIVDGGGGSYWDSDFHHNGDLQNYGDPWQNHLGKIYGSLDDLRVTHPRVQDKIIAMTKALISSTDIDGIRMDTPMQVPYYFFSRWCPAVKSHAASLGKDNFFIFGEYFCDRGRAASMTGRGKEPSMWGNPNWFIGNDFTMDGGINYQAYFNFFMPALKDQANGNLDMLKVNYNADLLAFDWYHPSKFENRYRHLNFYNNHDQWRVSVAPDGFEKTDLGSAIIAFWPGLPLFYYGDEQGFCTMGTALDGWSREDMMTSAAWDGVAAAVSPNPAIVDNFNMTHPQYLHVQKCMNIRSQYAALQTTDTVYERWIQPNAGNGIYAYSRAWGAPEDWALVAFNTWSGWLEAGGPNGDFWTGWNEGDTIVNAFDPSESYTLGWGGKLNSLWIGPYDCKVFVRADKLQPLNPVVVSVSPSHDAVVSGGSSIVTIGFSEEMDEASVKSAFRYDGQSVAAGQLSYDRPSRTLSYTAALSDGIHKVEVLETAQSLAGKDLIGTFSARFRSGAADNVIVDTAAGWDDDLMDGGAATTESLTVTLTHKAAGAAYFRVLDELTGEWSNWEAYAPSSSFTMAPGFGSRTNTVQYWADGSAAYFVSDEITVVDATEPFASNWNSITLTGSFLGWDPSLNNMQLVADNLWQIDVTFTNESNIQFKFTGDGSWSANWGECCQSDYDAPMQEWADWYSNNIQLGGTLTGTFRFTFNDATTVYTVDAL